MRNEIFKVRPQRQRRQQQQQQLLLFLMVLFVMSHTMISRTYGFHNQNRNVLLLSRDKKSNTPLSFLSIRQQQQQQNHQNNNFLLGATMFQQDFSENDENDKTKNDKNSKKKQQQQQAKENAQKETSTKSTSTALFNTDTRQLLGLGKLTSSPTTTTTMACTDVNSGNHDQLQLQQQQQQVVEKWKIRLQLAKPITWVPLSFIVMCGAAASGNYHTPSLSVLLSFILQPPDGNNYYNNMNIVVENQQYHYSSYLSVCMSDAMKGLLTMILAGPFSEGFAQTMNDWYDQDIDAINEPYRPIPSGAITPKEVQEQLWFLLLGGLVLACSLDYWNYSSSSSSLSAAMPMSLSTLSLSTLVSTAPVTMLASIGYIMSFIYSSPKPYKLKQNGWIGDLAICICYIAFPWLCGHAVFGTLESLQDFVFPILYSLVGFGPAIINDFKSIQGDKEFGLQSIPVMYGIDIAKWIAISVHDLVQLGVALYLYFSVHNPLAAGTILALLLPQVYFQNQLLFVKKQSNNNNDNDGNGNINEKQQNKDDDNKNGILQNDMKYIGYTQPFVVMGLLFTGMAIGNSKLI